jgi:hypothetical protein
MREDGSQSFRRITHWFWCDECEFGQIDPMPTEKDLSEYYRDQYRKDTTGRTDGLPGEGNYHEEAERARGWVDHIDSPKSHLDIGSSTGKVLEVIGAEVQVGVEAGPWGEAYECYPSMQLLPDMYDLVTCFHTLEHVLNPIELLHQIKYVALKQVCIEVPVAVMKLWPHLSGFTNKSILLAMEQADLPAEIVEDAYHIKARCNL